MPRRSTSTARARSGATRHADDPRLPATPTSVEVGVKFKSRTRSARSPAIRFYKSATNTGTHIGSLWTRPGQLLAQRDVHRRDRLGLADGRTSPARSRSCPTRRTWRRTSPRTATTRRRRLLLPSSGADPGRRRRRQHPPLHAIANSDQRQRPVRLQRRPARSRPTATRRPTTGSTVFTPIAPPGAA